MCCLSCRICCIWSGTTFTKCYVIESYYLLHYMQVVYTAVFTPVGTTITLPPLSSHSFASLMGYVMEEAKK